MPISRASAARARTDGRALLYVLPALILVIGVIYASLGYTGYVSLFDWDGISDNPKWVGFDNYLRIAQDPIFLTALRNVLIFAVLTIVIQMAIGLVMAFALQSRQLFGRSIVKVIIFVPVVVAPAVVATGFKDLLRPDGAVNKLLDALGLHFLAQDWLGNPNLALYALAGISIWAGTGYSFVLYQAALSQIDPAIYEAAQMDGAGPIRMLRDIVIPQLTGTHIVLVILGFMGALKMFDLVFLLTGGGPGRSTEFLTSYIYKQAVNQFHAGYSAALSIVLVLLSLVFAIVQIRLTRREVHA